MVSHYLTVKGKVTFKAVIFRSIPLIYIADKLVFKDELKALPDRMCYIMCANVHYVLRDTK